jgi:hypothetical protein
MARAIYIAWPAAIVSETFGATWGFFNKSCARLFEADCADGGRQMARAIIAQLRLTRLVMGLRREDSSESGIQRD